MKRRLPNMKSLIKRMLVEEEGQGMTEYALVLGVIAIGAIALITAFRTQVTNLWNSITTQITGAVNTVSGSPTP
jgi:pilus assembly protein Flp/PilA